MTKKLIISGLLGGIVLFIWGAVSWMAIPWHMKTLHGFKDQAAVTQVIQTNAPQSGIYMLPLNQTAANQQPTQGPLLFAAIQQGGMSSMGSYMLIGLITQIVAAFLVSCLLSTTTGLSYPGRIGFILLFALTAGVVTDLPYWNWFHFDTTYTLVAFADLLVGWLLAGLVIAKIIHRP